jgi:hypothetical protein
LQLQGNRIDNLCADDLEQLLIKRKDQSKRVCTFAVLLIARAEPNKCVVQMLQAVEHFGDQPRI